MDYKYIEQLLDRYFSAETTLEEENILRTFFSQENIPAEMEQWRALFTADAEETLGDDFDARMLEMIGEQADNDRIPVVKAREITLTRRFMPLFKAAAAIAIFLTIGGALQAPWDNSWNKPDDYAAIQQELDSMATVSPIQAENTSDWAVDSTKVMLPDRPKD
jgi:hypothetical protein